MSLSSTQKSGGLVGTHQNAYPLDSFYALRHAPLPHMEFVDGTHVPEPYRRLLVHQSDMTSTLERFHQSSISLNVIRCEAQGAFYFREVLLLLDSNSKPVEFGAIRITLDCFPPEPRNLILAAKLPLGRILNDWKIPYISKPKSFLKIESDPILNDMFRLSTPATLYGRRNTLSLPDNTVLAEIVEILPPKET
ncbi:MAG: hypothetical protein JWN25_3598 [Verrucomicrobiales bacterium]|nr:hypothetical protein [Verrucomicrobiales bacterium]